MSIYNVQAKRLKTRLKELDTDINHSRALEGIAAIHGCRNYQTLLETGPQKEDPTKNALARVDKRSADIHAYLDDIIYAVEENGATWAAVKRKDGAVEAAIIPASRNYKIYFEGDAINCHCPVEVLDKCTATEDKRAQLWRESAYISHKRTEALKAGEISPWLLYYSVYDSTLPTTTETPQYLVAVDSECNTFDITDGKTTERILLTEEQKSKLDWIPFDYESVNNAPYMEMLAGRSEVIWLKLGDDGHHVYVGINEIGGLSGFCALPWYHDFASHIFDPLIPPINKIR